MQINSVGNTSFGTKFDYLTDIILRRAVEQDPSQEGEVQSLRNSFSDKYCFYTVPDVNGGNDYDIYIGLSKNPKKKAYVSSINRVNPNGPEGNKLFNISYVLGLMEKNNQIPKA